MCQILDTLALIIQYFGPVCFLVLLIGHMMWKWVIYQVLFLNTIQEITLGVEQGKNNHVWCSLPQNIHNHPEDHWNSPGVGGGDFKSQLVLRRVWCSTGLFSAGWGEFKPKTFHVRGMDVFSNDTVWPQSTLAQLAFLNLGVKCVIKKMMAAKMNKTKVQLFILIY